MSPRIAALAVVAALGVTALVAMAQVLHPVTFTVLSPGASESSSKGGASTQKSKAALSFMPPDDALIPNDEFGRVVRDGEQIFIHPEKYAKDYVGNQLRCENCHLDAGRKPDSSPLWAAYVSYPQYREKNHKVVTFEQRLQDCFRYSMNGKLPPAGDPILVALESYAYWLASGAPTGARLKGGGFPEFPKPALSPDYTRGAAVYASTCAVCHGPEGKGQRVGDTQTFPALWGPESFNWGAGMHRVGTAARFIKANMPLGNAGSLTDQQALDVAQYVDSHERPQDPRFTGSISDTRTQFHDWPDSMYGRMQDGRLLGRGINPGE